MSTKRVSQEIVDVEVKLPKFRRVSQGTVNTEVKLPKLRAVSQIVVGVEVTPGTVGGSTRRFAPAVQVS